MSFKRQASTAVVALACGLLLYTCEAYVCYLGKQPDPSRGDELRWVLPYIKEDLCKCTKVLFGGMNLYAPAGAENHFYTDHPLLFVNNDDVDSLKRLLECNDAVLVDPVASTGATEDPSSPDSGSGETTDTATEQQTGRKEGLVPSTGTTEDRVSTDSGRGETTHTAPKQQAGSKEDPTPSSGTTEDHSSTDSGSGETTYTAAEQQTGSEGFTNHMVDTLVGTTFLTNSGDTTTTEQPTGSEDCRGSLGIESGVIPNSSFSASSYLPMSKWDRLPHNARLNGTRFWANNHTDGNPWLQVDLLTVHNVTGILIQGNGRAPSWHYWVTKLQIKAGITEETLLFVTDTSGDPKVFDANTDSDNATEILFPEAHVTARFVRIYPMGCIENGSSNKYCCVRLEMLGC